MPPPGKSALRKSTGNRRASGVTDSQLDLRSMKDNRRSEGDSLTREKIKQMRGDSTSAISPPREKSATDIISMFNQKSSTPKPKPSDRLTSPVRTLNSARTSARNSPGVSPVSSPTKSKHFPGSGHDGYLRSRQNSHGGKSVDSEKTVDIGNEHGAQHGKDVVLRHKPRSSRERPGMKHRPKSLIVPLTSSLDDKISAHLHHPHSDTELEDEEKFDEEITTTRESLYHDKSKRRSLPVSLKSDLGTLAETNTSVVVRDILIDDTAQNNNGSPCGEATVRNPSEVVLDKIDVTYVGKRIVVNTRLSDVVENTAANACDSASGKPDGHTETQLESKLQGKDCSEETNVQHWNGRNSPPERDVEIPPVKLVMLILIINLPPAVA